MVVLDAGASQARVDGQPDGFGDLLGLVPVAVLQVAADRNVDG
nr:hypothetical protein [Fodinicola feengrottensis]